MPQTLVYIIIFCLIFLLRPTYVEAKETALTGKIYDNVTKEALVGSRIDLLSTNDSSIIASCFASQMYVNQNDTIYTSEFGMNIKYNSIGYILRLSDYEHETHYINLNSKRLNNSLLNLGNIYLKRKVHNLSEVTVTASKVKFYNRGDTVVFNADAFILADGSMLDALIRQLPGVELHDDGRIYVNGKFVDNLILNGKDFFKGNNNIMLENLGAYTVKDIKLYERLNAIDSYIGQEVTGQKELVMDVRLKKDYMDSWLGNFMAGYGTSDRYIGRGFLSRITPRSRISIFTNANNINESRKPGEGILDWSPSKIGTGTKKTISSGVDYFYDLPDNVWKIRGDLIINKADNHDATSIAQTNFTQPTFTYNYSHNKVNRINTNISTRHDIKMEKEQILWWLNPSLQYKRWNAYLTETQAAFSEKQSNWSSEFIRNIYSDNKNLRSLINRKLSDEAFDGHKINYDVATGIVLKIPESFNVVLFEARFSGENNHENKDESYSLDFKNTPTLNRSTLRHINNFPDRRKDLGAKASYTHVLGRKLSLYFDYMFSYSDKNANSMLYHSSKDNDDTDKSPSYYNLSTMILDIDNSYKQKSINFTHSISPGFTGTIGNCWFQLSFPIIISTDRLHYERGLISTSKRRTSTLFEQTRNSFIQYMYGYSTWFASATYTTKAPDLLDMIDITDTTDPLIIAKGNPDLKNSGTFRLNASYSLSIPRRKLYAAVVFDYEAVHNAMAKGLTYDYETGIKILKPYNVNGNRIISGSNYVSLDFGKMNMFSIKHAMTSKYTRSIDIIVTENTPHPNRVNQYSVDENLSFGVTQFGQRIALTGNINYSHFTGDAEDFSSFNTVEFNYGLQGVFKLPYGIGINTDFTVYSRRGYQDNNLNTDNYVWNARISYSMLKGSLLFTLDGYDILHNLSNVFYSVNAQGRTETYRNVLPQYFMLGLQWKFNTAK